MDGYEKVHRLLKMMSYPGVYIPDEWLVYLMYKYDYEKEYTKSVEYFRYDETRDIIIFENDWWEGQETVHVMMLQSLDSLCYDYFN